MSTPNGEQCSGEHIRCENNFGSAIRYINSRHFCDAQLENNFGSMSVYFDNAIIAGEAASVEVENNFGETNLYIPKEWKVQNELEAFLWSSGGNRTRRRQQRCNTVSARGSKFWSNQNLLYLTGKTRCWCSM